MRLVFVSYFHPVQMKTKVRLKSCKMELNLNQLTLLGQLTPSQFPVFTIYVQKNCLPSAATCDAAWSFERVMNHQLDTEVGGAYPFIIYI